MDNIELVLNKLRKLDKVEAIILFGSQVTGRARKDSDIDIAVVLKDNYTGDEYFEVRGFSDEFIDVNVFNRLPLMIQFRVIRDGKILYFKDKKVVHKIKTTVLRKYLDFQPYINRFYKRIINNV